MSKAKIVKRALTLAASLTLFIPYIALVPLIFLGEVLVWACSWIGSKLFYLNTAVQDWSER